jgi:outer membrane protein assembly factor BamB
MSTRKMMWVVPVLALAGVSRGQFGRGGAEWMTAAGDAQRSSWVRADAKISRDGLAKPGFDFLWKLKLDEGAQQSAAAPVLLNAYIGYRGFRSLCYLGLTSDTVVAVDTDLGHVEWQKQLVTAAPQSGCGAPAVTRPTTAAFPALGSGRGGFGGRGGPARSDVGESGAGAVTLQRLPPSPPAAAPAPAPAAGRGGAGGGFGRTPMVLHAVTSDGMLHTLYVSNGEASQPAVRFVSPGSSVRGLLAVDNVVYAAVGEDCKGAPTSVVALDLASKEVATFKVTGGAIAGATGPALGPDGTVYVSTTAGELIALEPRTLKVKNSYQTSEPFTSSPLVFELRGKTRVAACSGDGRIHLLDGAALGGLDHRTPLWKTPVGVADARNLVSWQDGAGTRWLLAPVGDRLSVWKLTDEYGPPTLQQMWTSPALSSPVVPIVCNGVLFTVSTGATPVLYALDAFTGKEMWNSGKKITAGVRGGGLSLGNGQVYLGTNDGVLCVFGFPMEH